MSLPSAPSLFFSFEFNNNWRDATLLERRRVYAVRYMEWLSDACGLIFLDCHCLFSRDFHEFRMAIFWTIAYIMFGFWSAIADSWLGYTQSFHANCHNA